MSISRRALTLLKPPNPPTPEPPATPIAIYAGEASREHCFVADEDDGSIWLIVDSKWHGYEFVTPTNELTKSMFLATYTNDKLAPIRWQ